MIRSEPRPHRISLNFALCAWLLLAGVLTVPSRAQNPNATRDVSGIVTDGRHVAVRGAVVQIESEDGGFLTSYITDADGAFHFKRIGANANYRIWATYKERRSKNHNLSKFSSDPAPSVHLTLPD